MPIFAKYSFVVGLLIVCHSLQACQLARSTTGMAFNKQRDSGDEIPPPHILIRDAEIIVVARASGYVNEKTIEVRMTTKIKDSHRVVRFEPIRVLKGSLHKPFEVAGILRAEFSKPRPIEMIPYREVGRTGQAGCYAFDYGEGYLYLFMLKHQDKVLSPYWYMLSPTNEYVGEIDDPWVRWVASEIERQRTGVNAKSGPVQK